MLGVILYVMLLLINAMAILSEDRFLARSSCCCSRLTFEILTVFDQSVGHPHNLQT